jgi:hypothetical protein
VGAVEQAIQSYTGLTPDLWGQGQKSDSAEEARNRLNQALQQLGVPGEYAGQAWKQIITLAVRQIAKNGLHTVTVATGNNSSEMIDVEALRAGKWHFENELGVPMSWAERRDQLNMIIGQNPQLAMAMGLNEPINIPVMRDFLLPGMEELKVPFEARREKALDAIRRLLEQQPIINGPENILPSIQPEPFVDDPADASFILAWLNDKQGTRAKDENPQGYQNIVAYGMALTQLPPPMGTAPPMLPPGAPGEPPQPMGPPNPPDAPPMAQ